jgi:hypothetical protein
MGDAARQESPWLTTVEAAGYVKMTREALLYHVARGHVRPDAPAGRGLKTHRFLRTTLDRWLTGANDNGDTEG